jgi:hypothetical protein
MNARCQADSPTRPSTVRASFHPVVTVVLASLATPRVVLHDLDVIDEGHAPNALLVFGPSSVWIATALVWQIANPLRALVWVGAAYGVMLAVLHQILWNRAFGNDPPRLGGKLEGELPEAIEGIIIRGFAVGSGIATGLAVGAISGLIAAGLARLRG